MLDEVLLFVYGTAAAVILIAIVAYYYMPTLAGATQAQAEYVALRDAAPILILARDGSVHVCINSTAPQRVLVQRSGMWIDAQKDCRINPGGNCVPGGRQDWPFCRWYLGTYKPGDNITIIFKTDRASVVKSYRIAAIVPSAKLSASTGNTNGQNAAGGQSGAQGQSGGHATTVTMTGTVYSTTVATVTTTVTSYGTTTVTVTAPTTATVTYTVVIQDPSFTTTRTLTTCVPSWSTTSSTTSSTPWYPPIEMGRYGFQLLSATTSTVTSYTTIYTTSYVTSTVTTTVWSTSTLTYTPTVTTTVTNLRPGVQVICYVCSTSTPSMTCSTTTLVTTTSTTTIAGGSGSTQANTPNRGLSIDMFFLGLSAVVMMASSVMLVKKQ